MKNSSKATKTPNPNPQASAGPGGISIARPGQENLVIQPKLMVGPAGNQYEREADRVARQVMRMSVSPDSAPVQRQPGQAENHLAQRKPLASAITPLVQRQSGPGAGFQAGEQVEGEISQQRGGGSLLPGSVRGFMEPRFGADFSGVRVHANARADTLNRAMNARAFTTGQDIFFRSGEYRPGSQSGQELIAHELTHVVQQNNGVSDHGDGAVQRLIVNTGHPELPDELSQDTGWIVASDIDLAYLEGGDHQDVRELDELNSYGKTVGQSENIYLEGHGAPGYLGVTLPGTVARALNPIIPSGYTGRIRSHSCSAGASPSSGKPSGVEGLARSLTEPGIDVFGASGIALNHARYKDTYGTRTFGRKPQDKVEIDKAIDSTSGPVNLAWNKYVTSDHGGRIGPKGYRPAAAHATAISDALYEHLEHHVETHMLPKGDSITKSTSMLRMPPKSTPVVSTPPQTSSGAQSGSKWCFITTACVQARGLPDDCVELTTLRAFRDEYILNMGQGKEIVKVYYQNAPAIVAAINGRQDAAEIYNGLYTVICKCVDDIRAEKYKSAFQTYVDMVIQLRNRFTPLAAIPAFFYRQFEPC